MWRRLVPLACMISSLWGCGDGVVLISVNSGVVLGAPRCGTPAEFDLRDQGGLTVLVVISSTTRIVVAGGGTGRCTDLVANAPVQVSGRRSGDQIVATTVTIE